MKYAVLLIVFSLVFISAAQAENYDTLLMRNCANGARAVSVERRANALLSRTNSSQSDSLFKEAARLFLGCARSTRNPYARDWYMASYIEDLFLSAPDPADPAVGVAAKAADHLAATTRYSDVRTQAIKLRDGIRQMFANP